MLLLAFVLLAPCLAMKSSSELDWKWRTGRATYYGEAWHVVCASLAAWLAQLQQVMRCSALLVLHQQSQQ